MNLVNESNLAIPTWTDQLLVEFFETGYLAPEIIGLFKLTRDGDNLIVTRA